MTQTKEIPSARDQYMVVNLKNEHYDDVLARSDTSVERDDTAPPSVTLLTICLFDTSLPNKPTTLYYSVHSVRRLHTNLSA